MFFIYDGMKCNM